MDKRETKWGLVADRLTPLLAKEDLSEVEHDAVAAAISYLDECDGKHSHANRTVDRARELLARLVKALGALPANTLDQASYKAYCNAVNILEPDDFTERFRAQPPGPKPVPRGPKEVG